MPRVKQSSSRVVCLLVVALPVLFLGTLLYTKSDGHIVDYAIWRWMVTFERPVERVDDYHVVVIKSEHRLEVYCRGAPIAEYPVALSHRGLMPRSTWDDELTPEGEFLIASMQYQSVFGPRQMLLDTTSQSVSDYVEQYGEEGKSRLRAWEAEQGSLDTIWEVYDFNEANPQHRIWNDILIHGGGTHRDWTLGCIALDDEDVIELFDVLHQSEMRGLGVTVEICP